MSQFQYLLILHSLISSGAFPSTVSYHTHVSSGKFMRLREWRINVLRPRSLMNDKVSYLGDVMLLHVETQREKWTSSCFEEGEGRQRFCETSNCEGA